MTSRNIRSAFKTAGVWPTNFQRVEERLQTTNDSPQPNTPPKGSCKPQEQEPRPYYTPQNKRDIDRQLEPIQLQLGALNRGFLTIRKKADEAIEKKNVEIVKLKRWVEYLEAHIKAQRPRKRVQVQKDPNEMFYDVLLQEEAKEKAKKGQKQSLAEQPGITDFEAAEIAALEADELDEALQEERN